MSLEVDSWPCQISKVELFTKKLTALNCTPLHVHAYECIQVTCILFTPWLTQRLQEIFTIRICPNSSNSHWQDRKSILSAISKYILRGINRYWSHESVFRMFVLWRFSNVYAVSFHFISSFYYFLNIYTCTFWRGKTDGISFFVV